MEQESISSGKYNFQSTVAIIGAGPAGCICAKFLLDKGIVPVIFEKGKPLRTILPTGGGRCNLTHAQYDFKELAKNYPRGEKFLYSVFSKFDVTDTIEFFDKIGIKTYTQDDNRIFPISNSASDVRDKLLKSISGVNIIKEDVLSISKLDNCYKIQTNKSSYAFDFVVIATGGHGNFDIFNFINIIEPTQALVGLITKENFSQLAGVSLKNVTAGGLTGDIIFTHKGVSGPLIYKISSINARKQMPYNINLNITNLDNLQQDMNNNPHKEIKNLLGQFIPKSLAEFILNKLQINSQIPCHKINGQMRDKIINTLANFEITIVSKAPDGEVVTAGGVDLKEINPKTMEAKRFTNLYFCGEVIDVDGFCGGFNLQNCWSTGYIAASSIINKII